jgi:hypothetical protein
VVDSLQFLRRFKVMYKILKSLSSLAIILCISLASSQTAVGQTNQKLSDINLQTQYINESIHGIMVANKLFELFNQDVNQYVDLDRYQLQGFDNKDLPKNLFDESGKDYYEGKSPIELFREISASKTISEDNKVMAVKLYGIINDIDKKRFDIERYLDLNDLTNKDNLSGVYGLLENCVTLYENYYREYQIYTDHLKKEYKLLPDSDFSGKPFYKTFAEMHGHIISAMHNIRKQNDKDIAVNLKNFALMYLRVKKDLETNAGNLSSLKGNPNLVPKIEACISNIRDLVEGKPVEKAYEQYGKYYYTHNKSAIAKMNKYGNGFIQEMNMALMANSTPAMLFPQVPHYFKVIYPTKLDIVQQIASTQSYISTLPSVLKDRAIKEKSLIVTTNKKIFDLELFDHMVQDGDLVSLNFNGDWILEDYSLESKSKKLRLELNPNGRNFLLLYAASVGQRPPNTMAVKYTNNSGENVQIILKSDLKVSEIIEIRYVPE